MRTRWLIIPIVTLALVGTACSDSEPTQEAGEPTPSTAGEPPAPPSCAEVAAFTEAYLDTGYIIDRGPAARDAAEQVSRTEAVVVGTLVDAVPRPHPDRPAVAIVLDVDEVLWQTDGDPLAPGRLMVDREVAPPMMDGRIEQRLPVGARAVGFLYHTPELPDGWQFDLEGLWIECEADDGLSLGGDMVAWPLIRTFDDLVAAVRAAAADLADAAP